MLKKKFLLFSLVLILGLLLASFGQATFAQAGGGAPEGEMPASWEQFQKDCINSGQTTSPAPIANLTLGWRRQMQVDNPQTPMAGICVAPIVAEGKVFVLDAKGRMWAFEAKTGAEKWHTDLSCTGYKFQLATPAYGEGKIFAATNDGHVYALKADDGTIIWGPISTGDNQLNTPVKYAGGKVFVGSWIGKKYYCFNALNGNILWTRPSTTGGGYYWSGACMVGNYLVFGDESAVLTCVHKDSGEFVTEVKLKDINPKAKQIHSSVTFNPVTNRIYFTDQSGHCWAFNFNPQTGELTYHWHKKIEIKDKNGQPFGFSTSTPTVYGNKIYVGTGLYTTEEHGLHCLKEEDGTEIWRFITPRFHGVQSSPALSVQNNKIYFTTTGENGSAYCIDENGNELWKFTTQEAGTSGGYILQGTAIADGWVYFGNDGGGLYALTKVEPRPDVNGDGQVNVLDMILIGQKWGQTGTPGWIKEDVNQDGKIDVLDLILAGQHWTD